MRQFVTGTLCVLAVIAVLFAGVVLYYCYGNIDLGGIKVIQDDYCTPRPDWLKLPG